MPKISILRLAILPSLFMTLCVCGYLYCHRTPDVQKKPDTTTQRGGHLYEIFIDGSARFAAHSQNCPCIVAPPDCKMAEFWRNCYEGEILTQAADYQAANVKFTRALAIDALSPVAQTLYLNNKKYLDNGKTR